jgi:ApbE superfamily uncharacterized protein (UPF0280 family)
MGLLDRLRPSPLTTFEVSVGELTFAVQATDDLYDEARAAAIKYWEQVEAYVVRHSAFKTSLVPLPVSPDAPALIKSIGNACEAAGVGPMTALAGALVEAIAADLKVMTSEIAVTAEGESFVVGGRPKIFLVDPARRGSGGIGVRVDSHTTYSFYTSLGRIKSDPAIGKARAVAVLAERGGLGGAAGSAIGSAMHRTGDVDRAMEVARRLSGVFGAVVLAGEDRIGLWGDLHIVSAPGADR